MRVLLVLVRTTWWGTLIVLNAMLCIDAALDHRWRRTALNAAIAAGLALELYAFGLG